MTQPLTLGFFGHNRLDSRDVDVIRDTLPRILLSLLTRGHLAVTLVTPLAPGADVALVQAALRVLAEHRVAHRISVAQALPIEAMLADAPATDALGVGLRRAMHELLKDERTTIVSLTSGNDSVEYWLGESHRRRRHHAYRRANTYLACHADVLVAYCNRHDSNAPALPGGTHEALSRARRLSARRARSGGIVRPEIVVLP
jgi:hypothetical protein